MIHRYVINRNRLFGPDGILVSAATKTFVSGETLNTPNVITTNTVTFDQRTFNKHIVIPIELKFEPADYSDIINDWVKSETQRVINRISDGEKIRYTSSDKDLQIEFRFSDKSTTNGTYGSNYSNNGFDIPLDFGFNRFKRSYFRLYFYDSNTGETANLLFTEDIPVTRNEKAIFPLRRLYWERNDSVMKNTLINRRIYMEGKFFNAKTGQIQTFYNLPTNKTAPIGMGEYSNVNNREWRTSPILLINPNNNNGEYRFMPIDGVGGNTPSKITLSEFILT